MSRNVLQISHDFKGPFVAICRQFVDALPEDQVTTVFLRGESDSDIAESVGGKVHFLEQPGENLRGFKFSQILRLYRLIQSESYDLVIAHRYKGIYMAGIMSYFCNLPHLLGIAHEHNVFRRITRKLFVTFWRRQFKIAGVSSSVTANISQYCPSLVTEKRLYTLPNALPLNYEHKILSRQSARREMGIAEDAMLIGTIGRLVEKKSLHTLIEAFGRIEKTDNTYLAIMGDGPLLIPLQEQAAALGIVDRVLFLGHVPQAGYRASAFDLFVLPSGVEEAFGIVLLEAMIAKVPVLSSDAPGPKQVVGTSGWLFSTGDSQGLAGRIADFMALSETDRLQLGQLGYERVQSEYTHRHFSERLHRILADN